MSNTIFYRKLSHNPTIDFKQHIKTKLDLYLSMGEIPKAERSFMTVDFPIIPALYALPKVHKHITDTPPGRPILLAIGSLTEKKIFAFVDHFLQPHVTSLPSYVKDSVEFVKMIQSIQLLNELCVLVTMDIESLYTNIPL